MIQDIPLHIHLLFYFSLILSIILFVLASQKKRDVFIILLAWVIIQSVISITGFYTNSNVLPPRFIFLVLPPLLVILLLFFTQKGRKFLDGFNPKLLTWVHIVRIPVEVVLFWLFLEKLIPELMTFEGRNFDIIAGITAPVIAYLGYHTRNFGKPVLLVWNFICLGLLLNIVVNGALSVPFPFQQFGFDQPNKAMLYFPFTLLPGCIVPIVLLSHLTTIRHLLKR
jgi:hypothetical protein